MVARFLRWLLTVALVLTALESRAFAAPLPRDVGFAPIPKWIDVVESPTAPASARSETGVVDVLIDDQLKVGTTLEHYRRRVRKITSAAGVERGAEIELTFDPSYERFVLHGVHLIRGNTRIDAMKTSAVRSFDSEDGRDHQIYDGSRSVVVLLADVRPGDVIDYEASIIGQNPVFGGRLARRLSLASNRPTLHRRVRVVSPTSRALSFQVVNTKVAPSERTSGALNDWVWEGHNLAAFTTEEDEPEWYDARPSLTVSEFASWADVARWAVELYERSERTSPTLTAKIAEIRAAHTTASAQATAALRFVQDDVRYLGIELGESSHKPHSASSVFEQRFGDCKDKVMLLMTMLRALGIEAQPALVDTDRGAHIIEDLPSPNAFDHVIARIRLDGRDIWVDPTRTLERGPLGTTRVPHGRALLVSRDTTDLSVIPAPAPKAPTHIVREEIHVTGTTATLEVTTTLHGSDADNMRYSVSRTPPSEMMSANLEAYEKRFAGIESAGDLVVDDDEEKNVVVLHEHYTIPTVSKDGVVPLWAYSLGTFAAAPTVTHRESPLGVGHPTFRRHEVVIEGLRVTLPEAVNARDSTVSFSMRSEVRPNGGTVTYELQTHADSVAVPAVAQHLETLTTIRDALGADAHVAPEEPVKVAASKDWRVWLGSGAIVFFLGCIVLVILAARAWIIGRRFQDRFGTREPR